MTTTNHPPLLAPNALESVVEATEENETPLTVPLPNTLPSPASTSSFLTVK